MWRSGERKSNIWIAKVQREKDRLGLCNLCRIQALTGDERPFYALANLLRGREFAAAAIDAPFSVPFEFLPEGSHRNLIERVAKMSRLKDFPFPSAGEFVNQVVPGRRLRALKPLRATEGYWAGKKINVRSTLWAGPRGGAAMTSACLTLLNQASCPIWPWNRSVDTGLLVEAFPAAQLCHWKLPYVSYNGATTDAESVRLQILAGLPVEIDLHDYKETLLQSADALDAFLCTFAAIAVTTHNLTDPPDDAATEEGRIAVHK